MKSPGAFFSNETTTEETETKAADRARFLLQLAQPINVSSENELRALDTMLDRRVAALLLDSKIALSLASPDWNDASRKLAQRLAEKYCPSLTDAITDSGVPWKFATTLAREHIAGFKTQAEYDASESGLKGKGKYKTKYGFLRQSAKIVMSATGLSQNKACFVLEHAGVVERYLFTWAQNHQHPVPEELNTLSLELWKRSTPEARAQKLAKLANDMKPEAVRKFLHRFASDFPDASAVKDRLKEAKKATRDSSTAFRDYFEEGGYLARRIEDSLARLPNIPDRIKQIAVLYGVHK